MKAKEEYVEIKVRFQKRNYTGDNRMLCRPGDNWADRHPVNEGTAYWCEKHHWHICEKHWQKHKEDDLMEALSK
jgi:hypothetical protein